MFTNADISRVLHIPEMSDGLHPSARKKLTVNDLTTIFKGGMAAQDGTFSRVDRAHLPWRGWFIFINKIFSFEQSVQSLSYELLVMEVAASKGVRLDWARIVDKNLIRILWKEPGQLSENREMRTYLYMSCTEAANRILPQTPSVDTGGDSLIAKQSAKRKRVTEEIRTPERPPSKKHQKRAALLGFDEDKREELESCLATEASRVTEMEDRVRDLLVHAEEQANIISEKEGMIADLNQSL